MTHITIPVPAERYEMNAKRFDYYFMKRNGLWSEMLKEYEQLGSGGASPIACLIHACEIGDGIDQHASENLKAVSARIAAQDEELTRLRLVEQERDALKKLLVRAER